MTAPQNAPSAAMSGSRRRTMRVVYLVVIAIALALSMLIAYFSARALTSVSAPDKLAADASAGAVTLTWNAVDGADSYTLVRDGGTVIYSGPDRTFVDIAADAGTRRYTVSATDGTRESPMSAEVEAKVMSGWGDIAPFVAQFPDLLPSNPEQVGWQDVRCQWMIRPDQSELGSGPTGSGQVIGKARMACSSPSTISFQIGWMASKDATNTYFARLSKDADRSAISWRHGSGYVDERYSEIYLRLDDHPDVFIGLADDGASRDELLKLADSIPI